MNNKAKNIRLIVNFIDTFCILVDENEDSAIVELMMDNHKCIEWNGEQYYIPEDTSFSEEDEEIYTHLIENYLI